MFPLHFLAIISARISSTQLIDSIKTKQLMLFCFDRTGERNKYCVVIEIMLFDDVDCCIYFYLYHSIELSLLFLRNLRLTNKQFWTVSEVSYFLYLQYNIAIQCRKFTHKNTATVLKLMFNEWKHDRIPPRHFYVLQPTPMVTV